MKKYILILFTSALLILTGCAATPQPSTSEATSLSGDWSYQGDTFEFEGTVKDETITLNIVLEDGTGLYWLGTFPEKAKDGDVLTSQADIDALASSLYGSVDSEKKFTFKDGKLLYEFKILGTTTNVELERE